MNLGTVGPENLSYGKNLNGYDFFYVRVVVVGSLAQLAGKKLNIISNNIISTLIEDACRDNYLKVHRVIMYIEIDYVFLIDFLPTQIKEETKKN